MEYKAIIDQNGHGYYIRLRNLILATPDKLFDSDIADILNIDLDYYQEYLINNFNGWTFLNLNDNKEIYFDNEEDINKTIEWVELILVAIKLSN